MKIAIAKNGDTVSEHFGHVEAFLVVHVENQQEVERKIYATPKGEHVPGAMPQWIATLGADVVITGGIGGRASAMLRAQGIDVLCVKPLSIELTIEAFLNQNLEVLSDQCSHDHSSL